MTSRPPSAWSSCALKCLLFKGGVGEKQTLNKEPINNALLKEGGNLHSLTKTGAGELPVCSAVSHLSQEAGQEEAARRASSGPQLDSASSLGREGSGHLPQAWLRAPGEIMQA